MRRTNLDDFLADELADSEFRAAYEEIAPLVDFGCALAVAREQRRMSQKALAERVGLSRAELSCLENGDEAPTLATQLALARAQCPPRILRERPHCFRLVFAARRAPRTGTSLRRCRTGRKDGITGVGRFGVASRIVG